MRRQRNMAQMKEQIKTPQKELHEMEMSNLSNAQFRTLVIRMLKEPSEDLKIIKKTQTEMKDTLIEIKNNLQGSNSRMDEAENQINGIEHKEEKKSQGSKEKSIRKTRRNKNLKK